MTPILRPPCALTAPEAKPAAATAASSQTFDPIMNVFPLTSEGVTDGELEAFNLVAKKSIRCGVFVQRRGIAEAQQPERSQPLDADADGLLQIIIVEAVIDRVAQLVEEVDATRREHVANVEEQAHSRGSGDFRGRRDDQLELIGEQQVAAVRIAEIVARPEITFLEAAYRAWSARVAVAERRYRGRIAVAVAVRELVMETEHPPSEQRNVLGKIDARDPVLDVAAGNRSVDAGREAHAGRRKQRGVARVVIPRRDHVEALDLR